MGMNTSRKIHKHLLLTADLELALLRRQLAMQKRTPTIRVTWQDCARGALTAGLAALAAEEATPPCS